MLPVLGVPQIRYDWTAPKTTTSSVNGATAVPCQRILCVGYLEVGGTQPQTHARTGPSQQHGVCTRLSSYIPEGVAKHLIDLDEEALSKAQAELGTATIKDTVNLALVRATSNRRVRVVAALDVLASADLDDRSEAWR